MVSTHRNSKSAHMTSNSISMSLSCVSRKGREREREEEEEEKEVNNDFHCVVFVGKHVM